MTQQSNKSIWQRIIDNEEELIRNVISGYTEQLSKQNDNTDSLQDKEIKEAIKLYLTSQIVNYIIDNKMNQPDYETKIRELIKEYTQTQADILREHIWDAKRMIAKDLQSLLPPEKNV